MDAQPLLNQYWMPPWRGWFSYTQVHGFSRGATWWSGMPCVRQIRLLNSTTFVLIILDLADECSVFYIQSVSIYKQLPLYRSASSLIQSLAGLDLISLGISFSLHIKLPEVCRQLMCLGGLLMEHTKGSKGCIRFRKKILHFCEGN